MIKQIMSFLVQKWPTGNKGKRGRIEPRQHIPLSIYDDGIIFGYARDGESINDLR